MVWSGVEQYEPRKKERVLLSTKHRAELKLSRHLPNFTFVALREIAQRNVEWYSVHTNKVALREMAQRYF